MLCLDNVVYESPPPRNKTIFNGVNINISPKDHTVIYADNGAGKTTFVKLIMGMLQPSSGRVIGGPGAAYCVFENFSDQLLFSTVNEELKTNTESYKSELEETMEHLELSEKASSPVNELSYSQKARVVLASAYLSGREFILLDTPPYDRVMNSFTDHLAASDKRTVLLMLHDTDNRPGLCHWKRYHINDMLLEREGDCAD